MEVTDRIHVIKGRPYVRVLTTVHNVCKDHRFRVLFPTAIDTSVSFAETPFAIVERPIAAPPEAAKWHERLNSEKPFTTFCGLQDKRRGLALLAPFAPHECAVYDTPDRTLALTLFRSTFMTFCTSGEPDGELLTDLDFEYLLFPFSPPFNPVEAARHVAEAQAGVRTHYTSKAGAEDSFVELTRNVAVVTALKPSADGSGGVIRLWNPTNRPVEEMVRFKLALKSAESCSLNEENRKPLVLQDKHNCSISVPGRGLATVYFTW